MNTIFCSKGHENPHHNQYCQICGEKLSPATTTNLLPGVVLEGRYRLVQQIGQGGFGRTYLCEDLNRFNEPCVLKEFAPQVQGAYALDKAQKLFEREANVLYQLQHPQIPKFREMFRMTAGGGGLFLVQDFVAGQTYRHALNMRLQQGQTFSEAEVRQLLVSLLPVLEYTHSLGVIHRDIAPDNLICRANDGMPVLIDFGGVKQIAVNAELAIKGSTEVPTRLGKVGYAPHEQMQRGTVFPHSDLYALAATALVLLSGREPTELIDPQTMTWNWRRVVQVQPPLAEVLDRMLQPKPNDRYQSATEVLQALQRSSVVQAPVNNPPVNNPSTLGTVVVAPDVKTTPSRPTGQSTALPSSFWGILARTWIGILGVAAAFGLGWVVTSSLNKPSDTPTPSPSSSNVPTSPSGSPTSTEGVTTPSSVDFGSPIVPSSTPSTAPNGSEPAGEPSTAPSPRQRRKKSSVSPSLAPGQTPAESVAPEVPRKSKTSQPSLESNPPSDNSSNGEDAGSEPSAKPSVKRSTKSSPESSSVPFDAEKSNDPAPAESQPKETPLF